MSLYIGIESSCDETSIALLSKNEELEPTSFLETINSYVVEGAVVSSQIKTHQQYGGVIPEIGARKHADQIHWIFEQLVKDTYTSKKDVLQVLQDVESIFVTVEPGLISALRVGMEFAKTLQFYGQSRLNKTIPVHNVNHLHGHVASSFYEHGQNLDLSCDRIFPHLHMLVSGGNSQLIYLQSWNDWTIVGKTLDDAAGECLDKIGRMLGLPYPGGVYCARIADLVDENRLDLPYGMKRNPQINYSFSGLKTAVRYMVQDSSLLTFEKKLSDQEIEALLDPNAQLDQRLRYIQDMCISAQSVVVEQLIRKFKAAYDQFEPASIGFSGGVSANKLLHQKMRDISHNHDIPLFVPHISLTGDNAIMVALAGLLQN